MDTTTYVLASLISFSGILIGAFIKFMAEEEIKPGRKYFIIFKKIMLISLIVIFCSYLKLNIFLRMFVYLLLIIILSLKDLKSQLVYPALGILYYFSSIDKNLFLLQSTAIFIYGLPAGTLFAEKEKGMTKSLIRVLVYHASFLIISTILFLLF